MIIFQLIQKSQYRGAEMFASQLSTHLEKIGHQVILISIFPGDSEMPFQGAKIQLDRPLSKRFYDINGWKEFASLIKEYKPNIIQANAADTLKFAVFSKTIFKWSVPIVFRNANKIGDFINSTPKRLLNKFFMDRVAHVISVSGLCKEDFIETFNFERKCVTNVEIGINLKEVGKLPIDLEHIYKRGPVIVNVASLVREKNHKGLLNIFKKIAVVHPNVQLIIVGKGVLQPEIALLAEDLNITSQVHFLGSRNDVLEIVKQASAFVLPSHIEGLPGVILEAQYCQVPVVAYNVGGISEVLENGNTGYLVEKNDEIAFSEAVINILNSDTTEKSADLTDNAYQQVVTKFDNHKITQRFLEVYKNILALDNGK
ncbi:glycosyltransferase involved in cell wall biosynthesis [Pedobacter sp. CAN_A7]|uniref:glycosyltransferase family 4 protein n=1 Tax=Pedobacter sp. CAN_A7 TaxID=2787722 RepID=UPI0018C91622